MPAKSLRVSLLAGATGAAMALGACGVAPEPAPAPEAAAESGACDASSGISLPPGFCATIFADTLGHARHMAVGVDGTVYVNTWSGEYYSNSPPPTGAFLVALRDTDGDGRADAVKRFGPTAEQGNAGGTGIALHAGGLYAETNDRIVRYPLAKGQVLPSGPAATVVSGLPLTGDHPMHPFAIDARGRMFVNSGSETNTCQEKNRQPGSEGLDPCRELETRGGIWAYEAARDGQVFSPKERYATGMRNTGGISFDDEGRMFAVQHGRDQLRQNWPVLYGPEQGAELPAEVLLAPTQGADFGWPYCYHDGEGKLVLAPEYGGDGGKAVGRCATKTPAVAAFPAHWAPNDVLAYRGGQFPKAYRGGAFIAFHGSWNRTPAPQDGYLVAFQPLQDGKPSGPFIRFADGFAGAFKEPGRAAYRPAGLATGPDGALYIADDVKGRIWRITWKGSPDAPLASAPVAAVPTAEVGDTSRVTPPPGFTVEQVALGRRIYQGQAKGGTCVGCHGSDGRGSSAGPGLTGPAWLWSDGSVPSLAKVIATGVPKARKSGGVMPPNGGADLTAEETQAVAAYVWTLGRAGGP